MTLGNVLRLDLNNENRAKYNANAEGKRISEVIIDGVSIKGFSAFSFVRKLSYVKSPYRSSDGSLGNLNAYPVIIVPQLQIDFSLLFIDDYRAIMRLVYERREHIVQCYDVVQDKRVTERMYFEPEELPKLFTITRELQGRNENSIELLGVQDYTVVMVGTNNPKDAINIIYLDHNGNQIQGSQQQITSYEDVLIGENVSVEQSYEDENGYKYIFDNRWNRKEVDYAYIDKQEYSIALIGENEKKTSTIYFEPLYRQSYNYEFILNYGLETPLKDIYGKTVSTISFVRGDTYASAMARNNIKLDNGEFLTTLPNLYALTTEENGSTYATYNFIGWYNAPQKNKGEQVLSSTTIPAQDQTLYAIYEPVKHNITISDRFNISNIQYINNVEYNSTVTLPQPSTYTYNGVTYIFDGWYLDSAYKNKFGGTMKPHDITLYAKWVEQK